MKIYLCFCSSNFFEFGAKRKKEKFFLTPHGRITLKQFESQYVMIIFADMDYVIKKRERHLSKCLECGETISYGRPDKKFCCEECKNKHHNLQSRISKTMKKKVLSVLEKNYEVLEHLIYSGVEAVWLSEVLAMGFQPEYFTSYKKIGKRGHYKCFDIGYVMTANRISSISKIQNLSLSLPG